MASEVYEDALELTIELLEAVPPSVDTPESSYPLPSLRSQNRTEVRSFRTIVLENPFLRVTVLPDLGGRILSIFDKRTEAELLPRPGIVVPTPGGRRGLSLPLGIELRLNGEDRPNAMGPVSVIGQESPAGVWLAETSFQNGLSFHVHFSLPEDRVALRAEVRVFNRSLRSVAYDGELAAHLGPTTGLAFAPEPGTLLDGIRREGDSLRIARFGSPRWLGPRQVDTFAVHLIPLPGGAMAASPDAAIYLDDSVLRVQATTARPAHKLVLLTASGQSLEAPADLNPEGVLEIPLLDLPAVPSAVALLDSQGVELLRADRRPTSELPIPEVSPPEVNLYAADFRRAAYDPATRGPAHVGLGMEALAAREFDRAELAFEQSLLYNGDDPLAWWALAATRRLRGDEGERPELLNAHFLSPLEPMLRAEAFLGQPPAMSRDPSPLVAPIAEIPEDLVEVACLLVEHGLLEDANRWIDEALRHHNLAMLHYLMADILLRGTRMDAEAAQHLRAAEQALVPPLPWRRLEGEVLARIVGRFPNDAAARKLLELMLRNP